MQAAEHHFTVQRRARVYTLGTAGPNTRYCCIACHGYGQLAGHFIRKFDVVAREDTLVVAPEGLSRFYWGGLSGEVKASWMTKEDRLNEIADFSDYLSQVYTHYRTQLPEETVFILLGFSQGVATQMRWIMRAFPAFQHLILWAGTVPEDIDYRPALDYFRDKRLHFVYGTQDQFLTEERLKAYQAQVAETGLAFETFTFEGRHKVDREVLLDLFINDIWQK
jgi:predicted esterase